MVYLLHFDRPYRAKTGKQKKQALHYIGFTWGLEARIAEHAAGQGARLMAVIKEEGIGFRVARVWEGGDRTLERKLKNHKRAAAFCPCCNQKIGHLLHQNGTEEGRR